MLDCTSLFVCGFQNTKPGTTKDKTLLAGGWSYIATVYNSIYTVYNVIYNS